MSISSVVVKCLPEHLTELLTTLEQSDLCEVHLHDEQGRIIVIVEGADTEAEMEIFKQILAVPHVITADLVYNYVGDD